VKFHRPGRRRFVLLDSSRQPRPSFPLSQVGSVIAFKAAPVPEGPTGDHALELSFINSGKGLRAYGHKLFWLFVSSQRL
jgi:hypothetical protein